MKSEGSFFPQVLISKLKEIGISMLMPRMLALIAVQRQTAASRSTSPWSTVQQGVSGGLPTTPPIAPLSNLAQTPSFRASLGQLFLEIIGFGLGFGIGLGWTQVLHPLARAKKRRLRKRKRTADEPISSDFTIWKLVETKCRRSSNLLIVLWSNNVHERFIEWNGLLGRCCYNW